MEMDNVTRPESATGVSERSAVDIPARVPASDLTKEVVMDATSSLVLDDILVYLKQYKGSELVPLANAFGFSIRQNASKSQAVDCISQLLSMQNLNRAMSHRNLGRGLYNVE